MKTYIEIYGSKCRWCGEPCRGEMLPRHQENCRSNDPFPPNHVHEIWPGIHLGVVEARTDGRYAAILGILSPANMKWIASHVDMPESPYVLIEHEDGEHGLLRQLDKGWDLIDKHVAKAKGPVLFHCHQGASRSAAALAGYMVARRGMSVEEALTTIFAKRPATAHFWPGWLPELRHLEHRVARAKRSAERNLLPKRCAQAEMELEVMTGKRFTND